MRIIPALFFVVCLKAAAQPLAVPTVPHKMTFAGITLTMRDDARREIQKDVDALWQSPKHFNIKAERAKTYFPLIEKIFEEERVPTDFKYLVLQESALIADAVSVSNAVGFWQFKDFTAMEMGLRVDDIIDERMNIISSTRGAAKYIKKNNYQFNNWVYALQAYQMGAGGVLRSVSDIESGAKHMEISSSTYWYVKKCLAHKIAFESAVTGKPQQPVSMIVSNGKQSIHEVASNLALTADDLMAYNKWIKKGEIPDDRSYAVLVPLPENKLPQTTSSPILVNQTKAETIIPSSEMLFINGVPALKARDGETMTSLAKRAGVSLPMFMAYNDLQGHEKMIPQFPYFTTHKKSKAANAQVIAQRGDNLWTISQQFGVTLKKLKKYNRTKDIQLQAGQTVWLASRMPKQNKADYQKLSAPTPDEKFFTWGIATTDSALMKTPIASLGEGDNKNSKSLTSENSPVEGARAKYHIVQAGESVYGISKQYQISQENLIAWNNLGNNLDLSPGQQLNLFEGQAIKKLSEPQEIEHIVSPSDTLYGIARMYNVSIKEIMEWNNKKDFNLTIGEKIKVLRK